MQVSGIIKINGTNSKKGIMLNKEYPLCKVKINDII